jgi:hypothetical protein
MRHALAIGLLVLALTPQIAAAARCSAESRSERVPLLELYTSEGCDSCPPVDRWVSDLRHRGFDAGRLVVLAFHVDYWDRLGWIDVFGQRRFSDRQRLVNSRNGAAFVYTPQLMLNGRDYRRNARDDLTVRLAEISRASAKAGIRLGLDPSNDRWTVTGAWSAVDAPQAQGWLALYENRLETDVKAGENRNKRLRHDFVVRDLAGPFPGGALTHAFAVKPTWKQQDLAVAAFVQDVRSGDVLQALALNGCP